MSNLRFLAEQYRDGSARLYDSPKQQYSVRIPPEVWEGIKAFAEDHGTTVTGLASQMLVEAWEEFSAEIRSKQGGE